MATQISKSEDLKELLQILNQSIGDLLLELEINGRKPPSLKPIDPQDLLAPPVGEKPRRSIVRVCEKLTTLVQGPIDWLMQSTGGHTFPAVLETVIELKLNHLVSSDPQKPTSLSDLERESGGSAELITVLKLPGIEALMGICSDDILCAASALSRTMKNNKYQIDNGKSAFSTALNTDLDSFDYFYLEDPDRGRRFSLGMTSHTGSYASSMALYPFQSLPSGSLIVDVGGGSGHVSSAIAKENQHLKFIVQDFDGPISLGKSTYKDSGLPIEWQVHNVFKQQPVKGADVYFMRRVLHDHSDSVGANVLRMIVGAMDKKSRILIEDMIAPDLYGEDSEWFINHADIVMMMMHNAKERTLTEWELLAKKADEKLKIMKVWRGNAEARGNSAILELMLN
ncbi:hypothetical protein IFR05_015515 [Cadophora sp. M221]|nr:hypothetical protein IFR05_015515 [Cadophora sp. M221]